VGTAHRFQPLSLVTFHCKKQQKFFACNTCLKLTATPDGGGGDGKSLHFASIANLLLYRNKN
jgi:hypothetical protein